MAALGNPGGLPALVRFVRLRRWAEAQVLSRGLPVVPLTGHLMRRWGMSQSRCIPDLRRSRGERLQEAAGQDHQRSEILGL